MGYVSVFKTQFLCLGIVTTNLPYHPLTTLSKHVAMTMTNGLDLTPLQISQLPDDPTKPIYLFDSINWEEAPNNYDLESKNADSNTTRNAINDKYKENGNALSSNRYIAFGYYQTHDINDFNEKWKRAYHSIFEICKMVWREYSCYLTHQSNPTNPQLIVWTLNIALPLLFNHDPDYHLASILDIEKSYRHQTSLLHH
jgi:hypothetical protein